MYQVYLYIHPCSSPLTTFRTAVPFWGQTTQISSSLSPKRDCDSKGVNEFFYPWTSFTPSVSTNSSILERLVQALCSQNDNTGVVANRYQVYYSTLLYSNHSRQCKAVSSYSIRQAYIRIRPCVEREKHRKKNYSIRQVYIRIQPCLHSERKTERKMRKNTSNRKNEQKQVLRPPDGHVQTNTYKKQKAQNRNIWIR